MKHAYAVVNLKDNLQVKCQFAVIKVKYQVVLC